MTSEKELCTDWINHFPALKRLKSGRKLLCRFDSIVYGIELEKVKFDTSSYRPNFVAMCLFGNPAEFAINQVLETKREPQYEVAYSKHSVKLDEAILLMKKQAPFLSVRSPCPADLIALYQKHKELQERAGSSPLSVWVSLIQLAIYYGESELVVKERRELFASITSSTLEMMGRDFKLFLEKETSLSSSDLEERLSRNMKKGGWDKVPEP